MPPPLARLLAAIGLRPGPRPPARRAAAPGYRPPAPIDVGRARDLIAGSPCGGHADGYSGWYVCHHD